MPIDPSAAGRGYPPQPYEVSREKIREFADAIGDPTAAFRQPAAAAELGYPDVVAPPTFAMIPVLRGLDQVLDDLGVDYSEVIHVNQRFVHTRPIRAGDRLSTTMTVDSVRSAAGNHLVGIRCVIAAESGEPVCQATATLLVRAEAAADA